MIFPSNPMDTMKCKQDIYYLHGLYVYLTHVYICLHGETKVDYLPYVYFSKHHFIRVTQSVLRQAHKTTKSHLLVCFISQHMCRDISRALNQL